MSGVEVRPPDMEALSHWVREYAPVVLSWCVMALVVSVALRLVLAIFGKHSHLLRGISYLALDTDRRGAAYGERVRTLAGRHRL